MFGIIVAIIAMIAIVLYLRAACSCKTTNGECGCCNGCPKINITSATCCSQRRIKNSQLHIYDGEENETENKNDNENQK
jgi:hypothetical protein